jgi:hypothetical protein
MHGNTQQCHSHQLDSGSFYLLQFSGQVHLKNVIPTIHTPPDSYTCSPPQLELLWSWDIVKFHLGKVRWELNREVTDVTTIG